MNLRQIDEFLERHSAGWKPFGGDFRISKQGLFGGNPYEKIVGPDVTNFYKGVYGYDSGGWLNFGGRKEQVSGKDPKDEATAEAGKAQAAAEAAIKQAEFEASQREGFSRLALKRRKGFAASMLVDPGSALGSSSTLGS